MELFADAKTWVFFSFIIFVALAYKLGWPIVIGSLDARIKQIRTDIETAEILKAQAEMLLREYQENLAQAEQQAYQIIEDAKQQAAAFSALEMEKLSDSLARKEGQLAARLSRMKEQAISDIRTEVAQLATRATQEIISSNLDAGKAHGLIQSSLDKVNERLAG